MRRARTWGWARMRRYDDPYNDLGPSSPHQSCPDCIIGTRGYDFREGQGQHSLPNGAAAVFEINIDPIRTGSCELFGKVTYAMIDSGIEAKFFDDRVAFFGAAGDADSSCASHLGELPNQ